MGGGGDPRSAGVESSRLGAGVGLQMRAQEGNSREGGSANSWEDRAGAPHREEKFEWTPLAPPRPAAATPRLFP